MNSYPFQSSRFLQSARKISGLRKMSSLNTTTGDATPPHVLILGGAYAGLSTALGLLKICDGKGIDFKRGPRGGEGTGRGRGGFMPGGPGRGPPQAEIQIPRLNVKPKITILDSRDGFFHLVGSPLGVCHKPYIPKAWIPFSQISALQRENVSVVQGKALAVDPASKCVTYNTGDVGNFIEKVSYDYLVIATGLKRPWPVVPEASTWGQYVLDAEKMVEKLEASKIGIVVIGGGAVGIETAAEIKARHPTKNVTLVHSRSSLLSSEDNVPQEFKDKVFEVLRTRDVDIVLDKRVKNEGSQGVTLEDGSDIPADVVIWTTSSAKPSTEFLNKDILDGEGFVRINDKAQIIATPSFPKSASHFAIGDIAVLPGKGIRLAARAANMGKVTAFNLATLISANEKNQTPHVEEKLMKLSPTRISMKLVLGETAVAYAPERGGIIWGEDLRNRAFGEDMALSRALASIGLLERDRAGLRDSKA